MKSKLIFFSTLVLIIICFGFTNKHEIGICYLTFNSATNLTKGSADRLTQPSVVIKKVLTNNGEADVTRADGYRILYKNNMDEAFVSLKVELSEYSSYEKDRQNLIENLKYINYHNTNMESQDVTELKFNSYTIYGISLGTIEPMGTLGTFIMFPGDGVTVYFYFNNMRKERRNFESVEDYKKQRNRFIEEYTNHLMNCKNK
jgi:hypothetical protein